MKAAERLWRSRGFDETSVSEVCDAAGVSKGTFYFYFARKEDLLVELALGGAQRVESDRRALADDIETEHAMHEILAGIAARNERASRPLLARTIQELLSMAVRWRAVRGDRPDYRHTFAAVLERGQKRGEIRPDLDPNELGQMLSIVCLQAMLQWAMLGDEPLADLLWRRVSVILAGARSGELGGHSASGASGPPAR